MKKILIVFAVLLAVSDLSAQNLSFGLNGGIGHSWTSIEKGSFERRLHPYYNLGGKMVYSFVTNWGVSADVRFSSEGHTVGNDNDNKTVFRANYLRVPIQGIYFFGKYGDRVRPKISIGPSLGFLVGGKLRNIANGNEQAEMKATSYLKTLDFGVNVAAGGNVRIGPATWLNLDLAYYHGVTDIVDNNQVKGKNRNLGVNVGVTFPIGTLRPEDLKR